MSKYPELTLRFWVQAGIILFTLYVFGIVASLEVNPFEWTPCVRLVFFMCVFWWWWLHER